jgi:uncharacterized protein (DUF2267 family)
MTVKSIEGIDTTVQKTNIWINDIADELEWTDWHAAYLAMRAVLQTLRERLTPEETADLSAQLPLLVRGIFFEGWRPSRQPVKYDRTEFIVRVRSYFNQWPEIEGQAVTRAVFKVMAKKIAEGEVCDIVSILPAEMCSLWEEPGKACE